MRIILTLLLAGHGLAHLAGFLKSWHVLTGPDMPYRTTILSGRIDLGAAGMRVLGVVWLIAAFAIWMAAVYVYRNADDWWAVTAGATALSVVLTILGWPDSRTGAVLNAVLVAVLVWAGVRS